MYSLGGGLRRRLFWFDLQFEFFEVAPLLDGLITSFINDKF
jgi:hypothetical protein